MSPIKAARSLTHERDRPVGLDEGHEPSRPDHGTVTAERGDAPVGYVEGELAARVPARPDLQYVVAGIDLRLHGLRVRDGADGLAVELDLELAAPKLDHHAVGVSRQPKRCRHRGSFPSARRARARGQFRARGRSAASVPLAYSH